MFNFAKWCSTAHLEGYRRFNPYIKSAEVCFLFSPREATAVHLRGDATVPQKPCKSFARVGRTVQTDVPFPNRLVKTNTFKTILDEGLPKVEKYVGGGMKHAPFEMTELVEYSLHGHVGRSRAWCVRVAAPGRPDSE